MVVEGRNALLHETLYALHFSSAGVDRSHELTPVDAYVEVSSVLWSPDGSRLALVTEDLATLEYHAYVVDFADDYPPVAAPLDVDLQLHEYASIHAWCGSGAVIIRDAEPDTLATLWTWVDVTNPTATLDLARLIGSDDLITVFPSPTADALFVETASEGPTFGVYFVRLDGAAGSSELVEMTTTTPGISHWSPSGEFFVNVRTGAGSGGFAPPDLYDLRGPTAQLVSVDIPADSSVVDVMWAPDGQHVTYRVSRQESVSGDYLMDLLVVDPTDGSLVTHHRTDTAVGYAAWTGQGDGLMFSERYQDQFELFWADRRSSPAVVHSLYASPLSDSPFEVRLAPGGTEILVRITAPDDTTELQRFRLMPSVQPVFLVATALDASPSGMSLPPVGSRAALTSASSPSELWLIDLLRDASQNPYAVVPLPDEARFAWLPDGSGLLAYAPVDNVDASRLWWLDAASDAPSLVEITDQIGGLGLVEHSMPEGWE